MLLGRAGALALVCAVGFLTSACQSQTATPTLAFVDTPEHEQFGTVELNGLALAHLAAFKASATPAPFRVYILTGDTVAPDQPAMLGDYSVDRQVVRFRPRFPFIPGEQYLARLDGATFAKQVGAPETSIPSMELVFAGPLTSNASPLARVTAVYPSADVVPENLLRLYVHFSAPMRAHDVHRHVRLYDSDGETVDLPFVEIEQGLWDPASRRLTVFFHPGRIKRGVGPNVAHGPPLRAGGTYRLVIDRELRDAQGRPLAETFEKTFRAGPSDRTSPRPDRWKLDPPSQGQPLEVHFGEPLDHALLQRMLDVRDRSGQSVAGTLTAHHGKAGCSFTPAADWSPGDYELVIDPKLEDVAGNAVGRVFDLESSGPVQAGATAPVSIPFTVGPGD